MQKVVQKVVLRVVRLVEPTVDTTAVVKADMSVAKKAEWRAVQMVE